MLRLVSCRTSAIVVFGLVKYLLDNDIQLTQLGLIDMQVSELTLELIGKYVSRNKSLEQLDLSWNKCEPKAFRPLISALGINRNLNYVNLSSNVLLSATEQKTKGNFRLPEKASGNESLT